MTMTETIADLPPSAKLIYKCLEENEGLTQRELAAESRLSARTTRYALDRLQTAGLVDASTDLRDARRKRYHISEG
jgi:DNA-binding MarR family transcriptional regulator